MLMSVNTANAATEFILNAATDANQPYLQL